MCRYVSVHSSGRQYIIIQFIELIIHIIYMCYVVKLRNANYRRSFDLNKRIGRGRVLKDDDDYYLYVYIKFCQLHHEVVLLLRIRKDMMKHLRITPNMPRMGERECV